MSPWQVFHLVCDVLGFLLLAVLGVCCTALADLSVAADEEKERLANENRYLKFELRCAKNAQKGK